MGPRRVVSGTFRQSRARAILTAVGVLLVIAWAVSAAIAQPDVSQVVLATILVAMGVMVLVMAGIGLASGVVLLSPAGYRKPLGGIRPWSRVLRVGTYREEGLTCPAVALRSDGDFPIQQELFESFAGDDNAERLVAALVAWVPQAAHDDFSTVTLDASLREEIEASADEVTAAVEQGTGRRPRSRAWIEYGFPGLPTAILLDYGENAQGEGVQIVARRRIDLRLLAEDRAWLRATGKRKGSIESQVAALAMLFGPHETRWREVHRYAQLLVRADGQPTLKFEPEEPDRYR